jgi:hypothetical protein
MSKRTLYYDTALQLEPWSASGTPPVSALSVSVDGQRNATLSNIPSGAAATDYESQFRPGPTVDAQRTADMSQTLAAGESATDYEFQFRPQ